MTLINSKLQSFIILCALCIAFGAESAAQTRCFATTISGDTIGKPDSAEVMLIFYDPSCCHQCMQQLADHALKWQGKPHRKVMLMVSSDDAYAMRTTTDLLTEFFPRGGCPTVVYDRVPMESKYVSVYGIVHFPSVIIWHADGTSEYYPYEKIFGHRKLKMLR